LQSDTPEWAKWRLNRYWASRSGIIEFDGAVSLFLRAKLLPSPFRAMFNVGGHLRRRVRVNRGAGDSLRWTRTVLRWTSTKDIPLADITEIKAITPWYGLDNTVEVMAAQKRLRLGSKTATR
jgi:hypothetical protein